LAAATLLLFAPAVGHEFVNLDDYDYVSRNPHVLTGLALENIRWAFTAFHCDNWHPLTWLSLQLDATLWGKEPRGFHATSILLHAVNAGLLYCVLFALTEARWRSAAVALLFAVHPLRVESVAWISERKDVLSTFFGLLALWCYAAYARRPSVARYFAVTALFAASLLAKPMLVTLPCLMLVLDWWPLRRYELVADQKPREAGQGAATEVQPPGAGRRLLWLLAEKLPLFVLVGATCLLTLRAQSSHGSVADLRTLSATVRVENAAISYLAYLSKTFCPANLAVYYPHPAFAYDGSGGLSAFTACAAGVALLALTVGAVVLRGRAPYLLTGWLWFLGTLVPTIGLVQVGNQAYADRYTYFPQIGILLALCWGAADLANGRVALSVLAAVTCALVVVTHEQLGVWHDSLSMWEHTIKVAGASPLALICQGEILLEKGRVADAADVYRHALRLEPASTRAMNNLGLSYLRQGRTPDALQCFERALEMAPDFAAAHLNLGLMSMQQGQFDEAARQTEAACALDPQSYDALFQLGQIELLRKNLPRAADCFRDALRLRPDASLAHTGLGDTLLQQGRTDEGVAQLREAVRLDPAFGRGHFLLATALQARGDGAAADEHFELAVRHSPDFGPAWYKVGLLRARQGRAADAVACLKRAVELGPETAELCGDLASAWLALAKEQARAGRLADAAATCKKASEEAVRAGLPDLAAEIELHRKQYDSGVSAPPAAGRR
jgi:tetratricopeptide (TPR) repeat protein